MKIILLVSATLCAVASAFSGPVGAQATLRRLPDGHPDLQGLWMKSSGGFQGLFIGSLDGTNFAAGGRGGRGAGGGPGGVAPPRYEYMPEAEAERQDRLRRGYEDPEAHCHLPGVPRALDQPAAVPGNRFEALAGDRKGQHSIRVNQRYRITVRWEKHDAHDVCCEDYH